MDFDTVIHGGTIITACDSIKADVGIVDGRIAMIGNDLHGEKMIDASGLFVLPGAIDPHVHLEMFTGATTSSDDWETGTRAAAFGGTTTIIDFVEPAHDQTMLDGLEDRRSVADRRTYIDYALHMTFDRADERTIADIPKVIAAGVTSFKIYTTYALRINDEDMLKGFKAMGSAGALPIVHAENHAIVEDMRSFYIKAGKTGPAYHPLSRPEAAEGEAIERVISIAEVAKSLVYIVHVTTERGVNAIERAHERGKIVFGETCPQYLLLTDSAFDKPGFEGAKFVCSPPLRKEKDNAALWRALSGNDLHTIGTDHCPFFYKGQKDLGKASFTDIPGGIPGIEARLALVYTYGVVAGKISLGKWIDACSTMPAKLFGLYPRKGSLMPGADADIVLFDPNKKFTLTKIMLHENVDYTPYEGMELQGYPVMTILRGKILVSDGKIMGKARGEFISCGLPQFG